MRHARVPKQTTKTTTTSRASRQPPRLDNRWPRSDNNQRFQNLPDFRGSQVVRAVTRAVPIGTAPSQTLEPITSFTSADFCTYIIVSVLAIKNTPPLQLYPFKF